MKYKNQNYLAHLGKVFFAAAYVAIISPTAYASSGFSTTTKQILNNSASQQLMADKSASQVGDLPEAVKTAVLEDISQRAEVEISALGVVNAEKKTWSDGCLGLKDGICTSSTIPGWQVVVASEEQMWVYRTDKSGKVAKLDERSTQVVNATMMRRDTTTE